MSKGLRRQGRELALKIIYSLRTSDTSIDLALKDFWANFRFREDILGEAVDEWSGDISPDLKAFAENLVRGVGEHLDDIDKTIRQSSTNWSLDRMAQVDLSILRLASFELIYCPEVPASVVINEAIEIGKTFGTADTPSFVNGILDKISRTARKTS